MKLACRPVDLDAIRTDGGTQVREKLDDAWVAELVQLYDDGHEIAPILVVIDPAGTPWLADGFHRLEAQRRLGRGSVKATVREGPAATLDMAKMLAAEANKNGRPLLAGDKRRAVEMARSTPEGAKMGVRELARHCGVTKSYVGEILSGSKECPAPDTIISKKNDGPPQAAVRALWARIDDALRANASRTNTEIATALGCDRAVVGRRRAALGIPRCDPTLWKPAPERDKAAEVLRSRPEASNRSIADETGTTPETVAKLRGRMGISPSPRSPAPKEQPPSAPPRKADDPRDSAEVIQLRPSEPAKPAGYSSGASRDTAKVALKVVDDAGRRLPSADAWRFLEELEELVKRLREARGAA